MYNDLKKIRKECGYPTASALARASGVNVDTITKMETGTLGLNPTIKTFAKLAHALHMGHIALIAKLTRDENLLS